MAHPATEHLPKVIVDCRADDDDDDVDDDNGVFNECNRLLVQHQQQTDPKRNSTQKPSSTMTTGIECQTLTYRELKGK